MWIEKENQNETMRRSERARPADGKCNALPKDREDLLQIMKIDDEKGKEF